MSKMMVDKITISGTPPVDLTLAVKGSVTLDKDTAEELLKGVEYIHGEKIEVNIEVIDETTAIYNSIRTNTINKDVDITFYKGATTLFVAKGVRVYPKYEASGSSVPKITITGGKKFAASDSISSHVTLPS